MIFRKLYCGICNMSFAKKTAFQRHLKTKKHKKAHIMNRYEAIFEQPDRLCFCEWGKCTLTSHTLPSEQISDRSVLHCIEMISMNRFRCSLCPVERMDRLGLEAHINGARHAKAVEKCGRKDNVHRQNVVHYCRYCHLKFPNHELALDHAAQEQYMINLTLSDKEDPSSQPTPEDLLYDSIFSSDNGKEKAWRCRVCDTLAIKWSDHIKNSRHNIRLKKFHENKIMFNGDCYHCQLCACDVGKYWSVQYHIDSRLHKVSKSYDHTKTPACQEIANETEDNVEPNSPTTSSSDLTEEDDHIIENRHQTGLQNISNHSQIGAWEIPSYQNIDDMYRQWQNLRSEESSETHKVSAEKGEMRCSVCYASVQDATKLHIHLAQHFKNDFIVSNKDEKRLERRDVTKTETARQFEFKEDCHCNENVVNKIERTMEIEKIIINLDFNAQNIYSMKDKLADIKLGMQLCYPIDKDRTYCFVCQEEVEISIKDYVQHLRTLDHCECLDQMEEDHSLFKPFPDQFSQLDLARQYIIETEDDSVYCFICDVQFKNIKQHIYDTNHHGKCVQMNLYASENFGNVKLKSCDWYEIQFYWCDPCMTRCQSEVYFAEHLKSQKHADCMKRKTNAKRKPIFDFCAPCALLWYGYRSTSANHENDKVHMWLTEDGHYTSIEIPESAKILIAYAEDFVNKTIYHLDIISAKERAREAVLIEDLENSVKTKFVNATAYIFGSRVSGLASPDSDIDIFLDCGKMYNGYDSSVDRILNYMNGVHECLERDPLLWDVEALLTTCRSPIIKAHHRTTGLSCDISFGNGLAVENTLLIKAFNDIFPMCRKLILIVKEWMNLCELSGSERITSYAVYWCVIFYLQHEAILPSIATLIRMKNSSQIIAGWEVGVFRDFTSNALTYDLSMKELLIGFFDFYAHFDYRHKVVCPLLGEIVPKRAFAHPESLPEEMAPYKAHMKSSQEGLRIDSYMCIQDPFDLQHNLCKVCSASGMILFQIYRDTVFIPSDFFHNCKRLHQDCFFAIQNVCAYYEDRNTTFRKVEITDKSTIRRFACGIFEITLQFNNRPLM